MTKVLVLRDKQANRTIHILDSDGREIVIRPDEAPTLVKILKRAYKSTGIPREEWQTRLLTGAPTGEYE